MRIETIGLLVLSLAAAFFSYYANKTLGKRDKVKEIQKKVNDYQKELKQAADKKDEAKLKELKAREAEVLKSMQEMMFLPLRSMIVIAPVYFVLLLYVLPTLFPHYVIVLPFSLPSWYNFWDAHVWRNWFGARGFFIWSALFFGMIVVEMLWTRVEKRVFAFFKPKQENKPMQSQSNN